MRVFIPVSIAVSHAVYPHVLQELFQIFAMTFTRGTDPGNCQSISRTVRDISAQEMRDYVEDTSVEITTMFSDTPLVEARISSFKIFTGPPWDDITYTQIECMHDTVPIIDNKVTFWVETQHHDIRSILWKVVAMSF